MEKYESPGTQNKTPRKESKYWKAEYEKEKKAFIDDYHKIYDPNIWHTPISKDPHFPSFREWLKGQEYKKSPKKISPRSRAIQSKANATQKYRSILQSKIDILFVSPEGEMAFNEIPIPALQEILLNLNSEDL